MKNNTFTKQMNDSHRFLLVAIITFLTTACAGMFNPYIYPEKSARELTITSPEQKSANGEITKKEVRALMSTTTAIEQIDGTTTKIQDRLVSRAVSSRVLSAATFGLTMGLGVNLATGAALTDKSTALLALGVGSSYSANKLFFPPTTEGAYLSAYSALSCVANRANIFVVTYAQAVKVRDEPKIISENICTEVINEYEDSKTALNNIIQKATAADPTIGIKLKDIESNTLLELNKQLLKDTPDPDKVLAAAKSMLTIAAGFTVVPTNTSGKSAEAGSKNPVALRAGHRGAAPQPPVCEIDQRMLQQIEANNIATQALTEQLNAIGTPGSGCQTGDQQGAEKMSVAQKVVMLSPGEQQSIQVTGGLPDITYAWEGDNKPKDGEITVAFSNQTRVLTLTGGKTKLAKDYRLRLTDKSVVPQQLTIEIKPGR